MSTEKKVIITAGIMVLFVLLLQIPHVAAYLTCPDGTLGEILSQDGQLPPDMTYIQVSYDPDGWGPAEERKMYRESPAFQQALNGLLSLPLEKIYRQPPHLSSAEAKSSYTMSFGASILVYLYEDNLVAVENTYSRKDTFYRLDGEVNFSQLNSLWPENGS